MILDAVELKKYIYQNEKIEFILDKIGCKHIVYHSSKEYYSCSNYNGRRADSVNVKNNEYLNVINWSREGFDNKSDIITLVEYNKNISFIEAIKYLHEILELDFKRIYKKNQIIKKADPLQIFKQFESKNMNVSDIHVLDEELINDFVPLLYIGWLREGIFFRTAKKFGLAYSYKRKRVIIPMRYWLTGELLGINSRTTVENNEELGIKKYFITPSYPKRSNLYGLYENYNSIVKAGYVVIAESEKSVLKRDSLCDETVVALSGKTISDEQIRILIGLNVEIVVALDKDVCLDEIRFICEKFYRIRPVSYLYDKWDLLKPKDSPMDSRNKIYTFLFNHRIRYNESEHRKFLKSLEV
jgi:DNA primase